MEILRQAYGRVRLAIVPSDIDDISSYDMMRGRYDFLDQVNNTNTSEISNNSTQNSISTRDYSRADSFDLFEE